MNSFYFALTVVNASTTKVKSVSIGATRTEAMYSTLAKAFVKTLDVISVQEISFEQFQSAGTIPHLGEAQVFAPISAVATINPR